MHRMRQGLIWAAAVVAIAGLRTGSPLLAADAKAEPSPIGARNPRDADKSSEKSAKAGGKILPSADLERAIREQSIYIPYEKLRRVFEREGRGVFLPYEKFQQLWQAAQDKTRPAAEPRAPVACLITEADNEATVAKDVVRVKARLKLEILAEGWTEVPLRLADAAITSATLAGQSARVLSGGDAGYRLLVEKKAEQPQQLELTLEYAKAITRAPGQNSVSFQAPQTPVSRWLVRIPESGVKVSLHPLLAATEPPADAKPAAKSNETVILAFVGAAPTVEIRWTPKAEGATGLEALASVQVDQQVWVNEGVIRTRAQLAYAISRADLGQLAIEVPAGQKVVNVFDANVRQWSVQTADNKQKIAVQLHEPAKGSQNLAVELEQFAALEGQSKVRVPVIQALGVGRQQGVLVVHVAEGLRAEATRFSGLLQIDTAELPPALAQGRWAFSYRYPAVPFDLELSVEKVQPRILVDSLVEAELRPDRLVLGVLALYTIERSGVFRLDLDVPPGYEISHVRGRAVAGAVAAQVDGYYLEGDKKTHLVVNLGRKALGRVGLELGLFKELHEPNLLTPTGKSAEIAIGIAQAGSRGKPAAPKAAPEAKPAAPGALPDVPPPKPGSAPAAAAALVAPAAVEHFSGRVLIYAPESLRVNPLKSEGLRTISFKEALDGIESLRAGRPADVRPVLAFAFAQDPTLLSVAAERRRPQVTIRQLLVARVEDGVVKHQVTFFYSILYSGVKSLRIDVPAELSGQLRNNTRGVREKVVDPQPADVEKGYAAWSFSGETELVGDGKIELVWEKKLDKLDIGATVPLAIPRLKPVDVDRAWGQIVLTKTETIDLNDPEQSKGLRPIDPQYDLMPGASVPGAARAFEFHEDWTLVVPATRYDLQQVKYSSIERGLVRMVVTRARKISVQVQYRVQTVRQRLELKLPDGAKLDSQQRLNGKPLTLEIGPKGEYFVPVLKTAAEQSFLLELRYTVEGNGRVLDCPEFPQEPAAQKVYLCVYLPQEWALLGARGPWTAQFGWHLGSGLVWQHQNHQSEQTLVSWVRQPLNLADDFQVDGKMYLFSAMAPQPSPEGSLRLSALQENWLSFGVIGAVLVGGVLLVPVRAAGRALAVGSLLVLIVLVGVFLPTFAHQVLGGPLAAAAVIVLVIWGALYAGCRWRLASASRGHGQDAHATPQTRGQVGATRTPELPSASPDFAEAPPGLQAPQASGDEAPWRAGPAEPRKPADPSAPASDQGGPSHA